MGAVPSNLVEFVARDGVAGQTRATLRKLLAEVALSPFEINCFYTLFKHIDIRNRNVVTAAEIHRFLNLEPCKFHDSVLYADVFPERDFFTFEEFVIAVDRCCTLDHETIKRFAFTLYDFDMSGTLELHEFYQLLEDIFGELELKRLVFTGLIEEIVGVIQTRGNAKLADFEELTKRIPAFFRKFFTFQSDLRAELLGASWWTARQRQRKLNARLAAADATTGAPSASASAAPGAAEAERLKRLRQRQDLLLVRRRVQQRMRVALEWARAVQEQGGEALLPQVQDVVLEAAQGSMLVQQAPEVLGPIVLASAAVADAADGGMPTTAEKAEEARPRRESVDGGSRERRRHRRRHSRGGSRGDSHDGDSHGGDSDHNDGHRRRRRRNRSRRRSSDDGSRPTSAGASNAAASAAVGATPIATVSAAAAALLTASRTPAAAAATAGAAATTATTTATHPSLAVASAALLSDPRGRLTPPTAATTSRAATPSSAPRSAPRSRPASGARVSGALTPPVALPTVRSVAAPAHGAARFVVERAARSGRSTARRGGLDSGARTPVQGEAGMDWTAEELAAVGIQGDEAEQRALGTLPAYLQAFELSPEQIAAARAAEARSQSTRGARSSHARHTARSMATSQAGRRAPGQPPTSRSGAGNSYVAASTRRPWTAFSSASATAGLEEKYELLSRRSRWPRRKGGRMRAVELPRSPRVDRLLGVYGPVLLQDGVEDGVDLAVGYGGAVSSEHIHPRRYRAVARKRRRTAAGARDGPTATASAQGAATEGAARDERTMTAEERAEAELQEMRREAEEMARMARVAAAFKRGSGGPMSMLPPHLRAKYTRAQRTPFQHVSAQRQARARSLFGHDGITDQLRKNMRNDLARFQFLLRAGATVEAAMEAARQLPANLPANPHVGAFRKILEGQLGHVPPSADWRSGSRGSAAAASSRTGDSGGGSRPITPASARSASTARSAAAGPSRPSLPPPRPAGLPPLLLPALPTLPTPSAAVRAAPLVSRVLPLRMDAALAAVKTSPTRTPAPPPPPPPPPGVVVGVAGAGSPPPRKASLLRLLKQEEEEGEETPLADRVGRYVFSAGDGGGRPTQGGKAAT